MHMYMQVSADQYYIDHHRSLLALDVRGSFSMSGTALHAPRTLLLQHFTWSPAAKKYLDHESGTCRSHMAIQAVLRHLNGMTVS